MFQAFSNDMYAYRKYREGLMMCGLFEIAVRMEDKSWGVCCEYP
jgi:hypothetical protein